MDPLPWYRIAAPVAFVAGLVVVCSVAPNPRFRAMLLGVACLAGYGMAMDQVSARLCPEHFTVFHPPIPNLTDPTLLGIAWGFLGAWWGGAILGYSAGIAATAGPHPPVSVRGLVRPMLAVLAVTAAVTVLTGFSVWRHAEMLGVTLAPDVANLVPPERHRACLVVACYHFSAYVTAIVAGVVMCVWVGRSRATRAAASPPGPPPR